jgi:hypothetical protein
LRVFVGITGVAVRRSGVAVASSAVTCRSFVDVGGMDVADGRTEVGGAPPPDAGE